MITVVPSCLLGSETRRQWDIARVMATERTTRREAATRLNDKAFPSLKEVNRAGPELKEKFTAQDPISLANMLKKSRVEGRLANADWLPYGTRYPIILASGVYDCGTLSQAVLSHACGSMRLCN